jgi:pimeloyl-ACP methyl ester carboxylesterase
MSVGEFGGLSERGSFTRRQHIRALAGLVYAAMDNKAKAANQNVVYGQSTIPSGIRSRFVDNINGLKIHILEAGFEAGARPCVLLLHGFPELAYVWNKVMLPLASAGYRVIAPDLRGYGRTTGWDQSYDCDLSAFGVLNTLRDVLGLVSALGHRSVSAVVGRDAGSALAGWCALLRPDVFRSVVMMTAPFVGAPALPFGTASEVVVTSPTPSIDAQLAALVRPRKYYQSYYATREADSNLRNCPLGLSTFFRGYFYYKSADWKENKPFPLKARTSEEMAKMPAYYVMDLDKGMCETVTEHLPAAEVAASKWLTGEDVDVFATEYARTGFQGGLNYYRRNADAKLIAELQVFSGRTIGVPSCFIAGTSDWGVYQTPGAVDTMRSRVCTKMAGFHLVEGAGHWVQQEQPEAVSKLLLQFLKQSPTGH